MSRDLLTGNLKLKVHDSKQFWYFGFEVLVLFVIWYLFFGIFSTKADAAVLTRAPTNLGLVGYWSFNDGTSTTAGDFSGNGNNGALTSMAFPPTATSGWTNQGK